MKTKTMYVQQLLVLLGLLTISAYALADSNKWRMEFSGNADSDGYITVEVDPKDGDAIRVTINIEEGTRENRVANAVEEKLKDELPDDRFHVERDDGEDVLIKKKRKGENFDLDIIDNTVEGVRINLDKE